MASISRSCRISTRSLTPGTAPQLTVWNRTAAKAAPLIALGAEHAGAIEDAVAASPLTVTCLTTFEDTRLALEPAVRSLPGRALVTLNSASPAGARQMALVVSNRGKQL